MSSAPSPNMPCAPQWRSRCRRRHHLSGRSNVSPKLAQALATQAAPGDSISALAQQAASRANGSASVNGASGASHPNSANGSNGSNGSNGKQRITADSARRPNSPQGKGGASSQHKGQRPQGNPGKSTAHGMAPAGATAAMSGVSQKIGRNDPCYCGSGKKYKQCHGR